MGKITRTDVVLINPYIDIEYKAAKVRQPHYGLALLASCILKKGFSVRIIDADYDNLGKEEALRRICSYNPYIVGMFVSSNQISIVIDIAESIKKIVSDVKIVLGGPHITADPKFFEMYKQVFDYAIVGEAELDFPKIIRRIRRKLPTPRIIKAKAPHNLDKLPFPAYHLYNMERSKIPMFREKSAYIFVSRGCPFNCIFCSIKFKPIRFRSPKNIVNEIKYLKEKFGIESFFFQCSTFTLNRKHVISLCDEIISSKINGKWGASTRCDLIDDKLLKKMKDAGCININFGAESGSHKIRKLIGKDFTDDEIKESYRLCKKHSMISTYFWTFGHPTETIEDMKKTINLSLQVGNFAAFSLIKIYLNTKLFDRIVKEGNITRESWYNHVLKNKYNRLYYYIPNGIKKEHVWALLVEAKIRFYFRPKQVYQLLKRIDIYTINLYWKYLKSIVNESLRYNKYRKTIKI